MADEPLEQSWKNARVRRAEQGLADAVRTADDIITAAMRAAERAAAPAEPEPAPDSSPDDDGERPILRDAW